MPTRIYHTNRYPDITLQMSKSSTAPADWNFASRDKDPSPVGSTLFIVLRAADVYLQYSLIRSLGGVLIPVGGPMVASTVPIGAFSTLGLGLTPYHTLIVALAAGSAFKQIVWQAFISEQTMPPTFALVIAGFNTALNSFNTLISMYNYTSEAPVLGGFSEFSWTVYLGLAMYVTGMGLELGSEVQRKVWKMKEENKGKPCGVGLWGLATNVNYGGYALWRGGYACICGGLIWGACVTSGVSYDFISRAIPSMEEYLQGRVSSLHFAVDRSIAANGFQTVRRGVPEDQEEGSLSFHPVRLLEGPFIFPKNCTITITRFYGPLIKFTVLDRWRLQ